jgi:hypothetical protein
VSDPIDPIVLESKLKSFSIIAANKRSLHVLDRDKVIDLFEQLREADVGFDANAVEDHLLSMGWSNTATRAVTKIASDILAGKRLRRAALPIWPPPGRIDELKVAAMKRLAR